MILCHHGRGLGCHRCHVEAREDFTLLFSPGPAPQAPAGPARGSMVGEEGQALGLVRTAVRSRVVGPLAEVEVHQVFRNPTQTPLDAAYRFSLPAEASVYSLEFHLNGKVVRARVQEKGLARQVYREAQGRGLAASLLEQEGAGSFAVSVAGIAREVEVRLVYQELLAYQGGDWRFVYPVGEGDTSLSLELRAGREVGAPHSLSHSVEVSPLDGPGAWSVRLEAVSQPGDFVLVWRAERPGVRPEIWLHRKAGDDGHFLLTLIPGASSFHLSGVSHCRNCGAPREDLASPACQYCAALVLGGEAKTEVAPAPPRDVVLLLDRSASVGADGLQQAVGLATRVLEGLRTEDRLQVVAFDHQLQPLGEAWLPASPETGEQVRAFTQGLHPGQGTDLEAALQWASRLPRQEGRLRLAVLVSDGAFGEAAALLRRLPDLLKDTRLYVLGLGSTVHRGILNRLARRGGGACEFEPDSFLALLKAGGPELTDLVLDWQGAGPADVYPFPLPDLFPGQPVTALGRFSAQGRSRIVLRARYAGGIPFRQEIDIDLPEASEELPGLGRLWARRRIQSLCEQLDDSTERHEGVRSQVLPLALAYGLTSPFTALMAEGPPLARPRRARALPLGPQNLQVNDRRIMPNPLWALPWMAAAVTLAATAGAGWPARGAVGLVSALAGLFARRRLLVLLVVLVGLTKTFAPSVADVGVLVSVALALAPEWRPRTRYRAFRQQPYAETELEWARQRPSRPLDLAVVVDEEAAQAYQDLVQGGLDDLVGALRSLPLGADLRVGKARRGELGDPAGVFDEGESPTLAGPIDLLSLPWRAGAERVAVWVGAAAAADWSAPAESCREAGITVYTVPLTLGPEALRLARVTGGSCLPVNDLWLLLPLVIGAGQGDADLLRLREYLSLSLEEATEEQRWQHQIKHLTQEGFRKLWVDQHRRPTGTATLRSPGGAARVEIVTRNEERFELPCQSSEDVGPVQISLPSEELEARGIKEREMVLVRLLSS